MNIYNLYKHYLLECTNWDVEGVDSISFTISESAVDLYTRDQHYHVVTVNNKDFLIWLEGKS